MEPNVLNFFYFFGAVLVLLIGYMIWRPKRQPSRLKLKGPEKQMSAVHDPSDVKKTQRISVFKNAPKHSRRTERSLNVIFQYNGHGFDAYEVLGVAAGSDFTLIEFAYKELIDKTDKDSLEIYHLAFQAIKLTRL